MSTKIYFPELAAESTAGCIIGTLMLKRDELLPNGFRRRDFCHVTADGEFVEMSSASIYELLVIAAFQRQFNLIKIDVANDEENVLTNMLQARGPLDWSEDGELRSALTRGCELSSWVLFDGADRSNRESRCDFRNLVIAPLAENLAA